MTLRCIAALAILTTATAVANAQQHVWISAAQVRSSHDLIPSPGGLGVGLARPVSERLAVRFGYYRLYDRHTRVGAVCGGFILDPSQCVQERIEDRSALKGFVVGAAGTVARGGAVSLAFVPSLSLARVRADSRGQETDRRLSASSMMLALAAGAEMTVVPRVRWPTAFHLGAHVGIVNSAEPMALDAYSPFAGGFRAARVELRMSVWKPRATADTTATR